jgi:hypothetical protein
MRRPTAYPVLMASGVWLLAACSTTPPPVDPNLFPTDYKKEVLNTLNNTLPDPNAVRGAFISPPVLTQVGKDQRYAACVRYNARDASEQYAGTTDRIAYFFGGHLNQLVEATKEQCGNAAYQPFPELEKLCRGTGCK